MHSVSIQPADAVVNKIEIGYSSCGWLLGFKLYAQNGAIVLQTGFDWVKNANSKTHTENLDEGERILGYISRTWYNNGYAIHMDFQFVIGRLVWVVSGEIWRGQKRRRRMRKTDTKTYPKKTELRKTASDARQQVNITGRGTWNHLACIYKLIFYI